MSLFTQLVHVTAKLAAGPSKSPVSLGAKEEELQTMPSSEVKHKQPTNNQEQVDKDDTGIYCSKQYMSQN